MGLNLTAFANRTEIKTCKGPCGEDKLVDEFWTDTKTPDGLSSRCIACTKEARRIRSEAKREGRPLPTITEERRLQLQENARQMHEAKIFGGSAYGKLGGRPRKVRITDAVLDHFKDDNQTNLIIRAYESNLRSNNKGARLKAAEAIVAMESRDEELKAKLRGAGKRPEDMSPDELEELLVQGVQAMIERGEIDVPGFGMPVSSQDVEASAQELERHVMVDRVVRDRV